MRLSPVPEDSPQIQRLLAESRARVERRPLGRELATELILGGGFLVAALMLAVLAPRSGGADPGEALLVLVGMVFASRVVFQVGSTYTMPLQLAFVPALFVGPASLAPLLVATALVSARAIDVLQGTREPSRVVNALADSWFSIGPALVLVIAGSPSASEASALLLVGALLAQFAADSAATLAREGLHRGASPREQFAQSTWIYLIDALLAPLGFGLALAAELEPAAIALSWPALLLLAVFGREREQRLESLLELSEAYRGTARVLGEVVEHDDAYTGLHIRGVAELATEVAEDLGLDARKRRPSTSSSGGPLEGQRMLNARALRLAGSDGLAGEAIPIDARIVLLLRRLPRDDHRSLGVIFPRRCATSP